MAGLVGYDSSDEDDDVQETIPQEKVPSLTHYSFLPNSSLSHHPQTETSKIAVPPQQQPDSKDAKPPSPQPPKQEAQEPQPPSENITIGPVQQHSVPLGPSLPSMGTQLRQGPSSQAADGADSPYTASRALLRDLTLPPVPNFDIPPSPPGSPPPALTAKFTQFIELKKKGVHFNAKLAQSAALRNPSLTDKLMDFVDIDGRGGYVTTLPHDIWDPTSEAALPEWATRTALRQSQERVRAERAGLRKAGGPVDFVPAAAGGPSVSEVASPGNEAAAASASSSELGAISRAGKRKAGGW
ncbi:HCNGP-like protein [Colletotrichum camelliae]|nr:HCNGP-like protein [Colletotrichum camelliae]